MPAYFDIPLNLPHAGRVALRVCRLVENRALGTNGNLAYLKLGETADNIEVLLRPFREGGDDTPPPNAETMRVQAEAARLGRDLADQIAALALHDDRLGQCVRNLFECLGLKQEGAELGLRAGENPLSLQRP